MKNYVESISDTRNSAFHNLFPFRKSLSVHLTNQALGERWYLMGSADR